jgi:hypothetical protein
MPEAVAFRVEPTAEFASETTNLTDKEDEFTS